MISNNHNEQGFTLLETLIALFIFGLATAAFIGVVARGLQISRGSVELVTAQFLAMEGIELIEQKRYSNFLAVATDIDDSREARDGIEGGGNECDTDNGCYVDLSTDPSDSDFIQPCGSGGCPNLSRVDRNNVEMYTYGTGVETDYIRTITIEGSGTDFIITSTVEWQQGNATRQVRYTKEGTLWANPNVPR